MPYKAAFERITLITAVTRETAIFPTTTVPPADKESICMCKSVETLVSVCKHKQKACFRTDLRRCLSFEPCVITMN